MAIRSNRPAWDLSREQIEARARGVVLDRDHFARAAQPQVRADSAAAAREADKAVIDQLTQTMSPDEVRSLVLAFCKARERGEKVELVSFARADAANVSAADGLRMIEHINDAGGKIRTFENTGTRKQWMDRYRAPLEEQVMLNVKQIPKDEFSAVERKWRADREARNQAARKIAAGEPVYCDLSYDYTDLQG